MESRDNQDLKLIMNLFFITSIFTAITNIGIGIFLFPRWKRNIAARTLSFVALSSGWWGVSGIFFCITPKEMYQTAFFWWKMCYVVMTLGFAFYAHFIFSFLQIKRKMVLIFIYVIASIAYFFVWFDNSKYFLGDIVYVFNQFYWHDWTVNKNPFFLCYYICFFGLILPYIFIELIKAFTKSRGVLRNQIKYIIVGSLAGWIGCATQYTTDFGLHLYPHTNIFVAIYPFIFAYAIVKYRLMDIRLAMSNAVIFVFVYSLVLGFPLYLYFIGFRFAALMTMLILASAGPFIYNFIQRRAEEKILEEERYYQKTVRALARG
ncbi:MAG: hypothetical protein HQL23_01300, partial [Candidatus Omnitrophica bacterium]|nr:hypothetical protein [Candidatus Omnitrophota bacterium]